MLQRWRYFNLNKFVTEILHFQKKYKVINRNNRHFWKLFIPRFLKMIYSLITGTT